MRSTVGPLSPAVYWRRRALVLGAVILAIIILFVACSGGDDKEDPKTTAASQQPSTPASGQPAPDPSTSFADVPPGGEPALPNPDEVQSGAPGATPTLPGNTPGDAPAAGATCTDDEVSVTPVPAATSIRKGATVVIKLKIKNISARTCGRDLGAEAQELYVNQGAGKIWSSDTCSNDRSSSVVTMQPGAEREYSVTWNGRQATQCAGNVANGPAANPGDYEIRGRLATKLSEPVAIAVAD